MGIERIIRGSSAVGFSWPSLVARLNEHGEKPILRMIDGLPAFPDEVPEQGWKELRIGLLGGMVTLHRSGNDIRCVTWGTADPQLQRSWDALTSTLATIMNGQIETDGKLETAEEFQQRIG